MRLSLVQYQTTAVSVYGCMGDVCGWWPRPGVCVNAVLPDSNNFRLRVLLGRADRKLLGFSIRSRPAIPDRKV